MTWAARNQKEHDGKACSVQDLSSKVRRISSEHILAWQNKVSQTRVHNWTSPLESFIKINVDAAIRDNFVVITAIARDNIGQIIGVKF